MLRAVLSKNDEVNGNSTPSILSSRSGILSGLGVINLEIASYFFYDINTSLCKQGV